MAKEQKIHKAEIGWPVLWWPEGDLTRTPLPAFINQVNQNALALTAFETGIPRFSAGAIWRQDERAKVDDMARRRGGVWDFLEGFPYPVADTRSPYPERIKKNRPGPINRVDALPTAVKMKKEGKTIAEIAQALNTSWTNVEDLLSLEQHQAMV